MAERVVSARGPGRVNLIGEHTDYNGGLSLPFAIDRGVTVTATAAPGEDGVTAHALDLGEEDAFALGDPGAPGEVRGWRGFVRGAVGELTAGGATLVPARLEISGDIPRGSGLSSSAALSTALCLALLALAEEPEPEDRRELARLCSRVENEWVGAQTGLMDQFAALLGEPGHALLIDFATLAVESVPLELGGHTLVTVDSGASHDLATGGYNERHAECLAACERLGIEHLSQATDEQADRLPEPLRSRARHVLGENERVRETARALAAGDLARVGALLDAGHASLRDLYAASVPEVEATVGRLKAAGALGARMVGGGFGGSVLALFAPGSTPPEDAIVVAPGPPARVLG